MTKTILSLSVLLTSFTAGTAHAYLSPGEVFPELKSLKQEQVQEAPVQEAQVQEAPVQALPVLLEPAEMHRAPSSLGLDLALLGGGFIVALGVFALIAHKRNRKIVDQI
ncbi:MAG: hypothetical protein HN666_04970 [Candidatus Peribacter sp.]|nr:hypothetical protein [Candidatus Peribacter sp.]MBT6823689.1 hypothetical protein [Candidatus Peribacter sp.]MBT7494558.1 hypothetical protein [Candidatus Peribacter sp.]MBT7762056.1 hypothetical protein [Candidatus Peribacter sp.]